MDSSFILNPLQIGIITRSEAESNNVPYIRNNVSADLRKYIREKFNVDDDFHVEEGNNENLLIINNRNDVLPKYPH